MRPWRLAGTQSEEAAMMRSDKSAMRASRRPWWQNLRWITAGIAAGIVGLLAWGLFGPEPPITVSRNTTFLTAPLAADGLPDSGAAVLAAMGPAPKPEENAAVELLQVMWPLKLEAADLPLVCQALGIPAVPPADPLRDPTKDAATQVTDDMFDAAVERPWTGAEFPELEAWLVAHEAAVDRLVAAADRPRCWLPSPALLRPGPQMLVVALLAGHEQGARVASRLIVCRAMGHVAAGRHAAAWRDIRAVYRLGRLLGEPRDAPQFFITQFAAIAVNASADAGMTRGLLASAGLQAELLAEIRRDLDALGPLPEPVVGLFHERLLTLDSAIWASGRRASGSAGPASRLGTALDPLGSSPSVGTFRRTTLDWDVTLGQLNATYDKLDAAARLPTHAARQAEAARLDREHRRAMLSRFGWGSVGTVLTGLCSRIRRSAVVGEALGDVLLPPTETAFAALTRSRASFDLTRTAAAVAAWKSDRAAGDDPYPDTLAALVPKYLPAVPLDPFTDKPFIYERRGEGYLLASVGENGVYDGGDAKDGWIVGGEWQTARQEVDSRKSDIVVRMPVPPRPAAP